MNLLEAFEKRAVSGIDAQPEKSIETLLSKLFFFGNKVYKVYKWEKKFFGDFSSLDFRKQFYAEDFFWNNAMAPHIYIELKPVKTEADIFVKSDTESAEDFYIVMNKIEESDNLTKRLITKTITLENLRDITIEMTSRLKTLTEEKRNGLKNVIDKGLRNIELEIAKDLKDWCYMASPKFPKEKADQAVEILKKIVTEDEYFGNFKNSDLSLAIDGHSDNILFSSTENRVGFLDIFPPKDLWRVVDPFYNICRLATDVAVLGGTNFANVIYEEYSKSMPTASEKIKNVYELRAALIKGPYLSVLKRDDEAEKYFDFINHAISKLA